MADARRSEEVDRATRRRIEISESGGSTIFRNRRQLAPHLATAGVLGLGAMLHAADGLGDDRLSGSGVYYFALGGVATVAAIVLHRVVPRRWRRRTLAAVLGGVAWLAWATAHGVSWTSSAALLLIEMLCAARWWQACRLGHPDGRPEAPIAKPVDAVTGPDRDNIPGLWDAYIGNKDGALAGSYLHTRVVDDHRESYTVELVPGKHSLDKAVSSLDRIQSGLRRPQQEIIVEPHPSGDSAQLTLTIVTKSPIKNTVPFDGPKYFRVGHDSWIEPGGYADGEGRVRVGLYAANSARHLVMFGGQGSGKTALLNQMAVSAKASGHTVVWYLDGQGGASSPQLMKYADWAPTGPDAAEEMLKSLERVFAVRGLIMKVNRLAGLSPTAGLPGLVVIIDECHVVFDPDRADLVKRWTDLAAIARKLCVAFWAATQHPELASFGGKDKLRALLMQYTTLVLRTASAVANNILRLQVDPSKLPSLPGYGYVVAGDKAEGVRSAPFRADFLDDNDGIADAWFEAHGGVPLDPASAKAAGPQYVDRIAIAERQVREDEVQLAQWMDDYSPAPEVLCADGPASNAVAAEEGPLELADVTAFPQPLSLTAGRPHDLTDSQAAVWALVEQGIEKAGDIATAADLSASQTYKLLGELVAGRHLQKAGHGRYTSLPFREQEGHLDR